MAPNSNNSNDDLQKPLPPNLPNRIVSLWIPVGLVPSGLVILLHTSIMWDDFLRISMVLHMLDLFSVILPIQLFYFLLHFYLRLRLRFSSDITNSISYNLLILPIAHPFVLLANIEMYESSKIDCWGDWFMLFPDVLKFFPA
jgi:hypothetical protein